MWWERRQERFQAWLWDLHWFNTDPDSAFSNCGYGSRFLQLDRPGPRICISWWRMPAWKLASGERGEVERNKMKKALHDFMQEFGEGGWETQTFLQLHGIDQSAEGGSRQPAGGRKGCQGTDQEENTTSLPHWSLSVSIPIAADCWWCCFGHYCIWLFW